MGSGRGTAEPLRSGGGRYRIDVAFDRDTLTLIIEATERYSVPGSSPDARPFEVTDTGGTTLQVDTCPDEDGTIVVTANASGTYDVVGEGLSYHASLDTRDVATVTVNPEAEIASRQHLLTVRGSAIGDRPAFAGGEGAVDSQLAASLTWSGEASAAAPAVTLDSAEGVDSSRPPLGVHRWGLHGGPRRCRHRCRRDRLAGWPLPRAQGRASGQDRWTLAPRPRSR